MRSGMYWVAVFLLAFLPEKALAGTHAFIPLSTQPNVDRTDRLNWLRNGMGDDGYVRAVATLELQDPCLPVGYAGWLSTIGKEKIQLAVSIKFTGLRSPFEDKEIPLAVIDGRENPGGCIEVKRTAVTIVPTTLLRRTDPNDPIYFEVKARTTSDAQLNLASSAQAGLTLASLFAGPASAATISAASKVLAEPAIANAEQYMQAKMGSRVPAQASRSFTAGDLRQGIIELTFPVHLGEFGRWTDYPGDEAKAIPLLRKAKAESQDSPVFTVKVRFYFTRSQFPLTYQANGFPNGREIKDSEVLSNSASEGSPTLFQLLSGSAKPNDPLLLTLFRSAANPVEFKTYCDQALEKLLVQRELNIQDRSIALRSFINVARGNASWYGTALGNGCTQPAHVDVANMWLQVFGPASPPSPPLLSDMMLRPPAGQDAKYETWLRRSNEPLNSLRLALRANENKDQYFLRASKGRDIEILASKGSGAWPDPAVIEPGSKPWIARLSAKKADAVGCFAYPYFDPSNTYDVETRAGSFLILDDRGFVWVANPGFSKDGSYAFETLEISQLNEKWKNWYESLANLTLIGADGDCKAIIPALGKAPLGM